MANFSLIVKGGEALLSDVGENMAAFFFMARGDWCPVKGRRSYQHSGAFFPALHDRDREPETSPRALSTARTKSETCHSTDNTSLIDTVTVAYIGNLDKHQA